MNHRHLADGCRDRIECWLAHPWKCKFSLKTGKCPNMVEENKYTIGYHIKGTSQDNSENNAYCQKF